MEFLESTRGYNMNDVLNDKSAIARISRMLKVADGNAMMTTSGGEFSAILPHLVRRAVGYDIPLVFIDTMHYTKPTYDMIEYFDKQGFKLHVYRSEYTQEELQERYPDWWNDADESYAPAIFEKVVRHIKHEPLERAIQELEPEMWLSGLTAFKSQARSQKSLIEYNAMEIAKLYPIIDWQLEETNDYINWHSLPRNEHHFDISKGLSQKNECGIHTAFGE